ncbi:MFS transporter [Streptomyces sp. RTd22]|uniref:MFS transporter n=1 Tax=Streptomyces sp. RTd22 TaxID=1841249 RepID=UPI0007C50663|nr:MFS transporter [Streptomyces sp. RTd22]
MEGGTAKPVPLWADRDFTIFWCGQTLSELGNAFALVALPLLVLDATGSVAQMGLLTAVAGVASIATGLFAGILVDRLPRRQLMIVCDVVRVVLVALIPVSWAMAGPQVWLLYVVMAVAAVFDMVFKVTYVAAVPNLVDAERIIEANGRLTTTNAIAFILGPMLAGGLSGLLGPTAAIAVNAASFAASALALSLIRLREAAVDEATPPTAVAGRRGAKREFLAGFVFLWRSPVLRWLTVLLTGVSLIGLGMTDVFIYQIREGLDAGDRTVGVVMGVAGAGTVLAAVLIPVLRRAWGFGVCWLGSYTLCGLALGLLSRSTTVWGTTVTVLCYQFGMALAGISSMSLRQAVTPDHLLGRVTSAFWTLHNALAPLGAAGLTALVARFGVRAPLLGSAALFLLIVVVGVCTPIRQRAPGVAAG